MKQNNKTYGNHLRIIKWLNNIKVTKLKYRNKDFRKASKFSIF
jgi:hypothetical protein